MSPLTQDFPGFHSFFEPKAAPAGTLSAGSAQTLAAVTSARAVVEGAQQFYQPIYRDGAVQNPSPREKLLQQDHDFVAAEFAGVKQKNQIRVLDIGCNAGYVSFLLSETFPNALGFEINPDNLRLCRAIKDHTGASAQFFGYDILDLVEKDAADLENLDAILLLNVVHQLIFAKGIPYVKAFFAKLARSVDFILVELAPRRDYVRFGKDLALPLVPAEIFEDCTDSTITLLKAGHRPIYAIKRRRLTVGGRTVDFSERQFGNHPQATVNRKYYYGSNSFTKVMRYTSAQGAGKHATELRILQSLDGLAVAPKPLSWDSDAHIGRICMERIYGVSLRDSLTSLKPAQKPECVAEILRISQVLAEKTICQNDFSSQNLLVLSDGSMRMIDFELTGTAFSRDPFGAFLWMVNDILKGEPESFRLRAPKTLILEPGQAERVDAARYPVLDTAALHSSFGAPLAQIIAEAASTKLSWQGFVAKSQAALRKPA